MKTADCAVIGAGIIGGSIAWRLARAGLRMRALRMACLPRGVEIREGAQVSEIRPQR